MADELKYFAKHYAVLAFLLTLGVGGVVMFRSNLELAQTILWITVGCYAAWGIFHHLVRKDLTFGVVLEYVLISAIAGLIIRATLLAL